MTEQTNDLAPDLFDPADHNVDEVNAYLATADADERARVLGIEDGRDGGPRTTIRRDWPEPEPAEPDAPTDPEDVETKATTFQEAAEAVPATDEPAGAFVTSTDALKAKGESKGLTFAEQAAIAREQFGDGR